MTLLALSWIPVAWGDNLPATVTSVPSPAVTNKALEVRIETQDMGSEVYCYTWCAAINGTEKSPFAWGDVNVAKFRMSGSAGSYSFAIADLKDFYGLTDNELAGLTQLGFIAKTKSGQQTGNCMIDVVQGRVNVYGGGEGTAENPFLIKTAAHLEEFAAEPQDWQNDVYVKLAADIDASSLSRCIGSVASPYQGHFDGAGHSVKNISLSATGLGSAAGLFAAIRGASISDLGVVNAAVSGVNHAGAIVGKAESGSIARCYATGRVNGSSVCVGGLVGENLGAAITDCYTGVTVSNDNDYATGGVVGKNSGTVRNVYATGEISGKDYVGGIVGANYGTVSNSIALNSKVLGENNYTARFGGNDNSRNTSTANHSWQHIAPATPEWTEHGDHATMHAASEILDCPTFESLMQWDFENVWKWERDGDNNVYPVLRDISGQTNVVPAVLYDMSTDIKTVAGSPTGVSVAPNPFVESVSVISAAPIESVALYSFSGIKMAGAECNGDFRATINADGLAAGFYILTAVCTDGTVSSFKVCKN